MNWGGILESIKTVINLTRPIEWDELGVIATVLAVIVALHANRKATQQLKSALEMQEQSKNVSLLDKRIELAESIQSGKFVSDFVSEMTLEALFDDKTFAQYKEWKKQSEKIEQIEQELQEFNRKTRKPDGAGGFYTVSVAIEIGGTEIEKCNFPRDVLDKYAEISDRIKAAKECKEKEKERLLQFMREFTKKSIESLDVKYKGTERK